jgi:hypothetical protein
MGLDCFPAHIFLWWGEVVQGASPDQYQVRYVCDCGADFWIGCSRALLEVFASHGDYVGMEV